ncbi:MAG: glycoside hydrolase, partial [Armatimonadetes bacterium]|nr:glycoside hydrolase [Armatimonadota bacterium]
SGERVPDFILQYPDAGTGMPAFAPPNGDYDELPRHPVTLTQPFYMAVHEVTNELYEQFDRKHVYYRGRHGFSVEDKEAAVFLSWDEARAFCEWLSRREGRKYRLPTEAEWEYACRAGTDTPFSSGMIPPAGSLKNPCNSWYPVPERSRGRAEVVPLHVGRGTANPWGLYDMHGNVEEWCHDWYGPYPSAAQRDPVGYADGEFRVTRGGSHSTLPFYLRSTNRMGTLPEDRNWYIGFRPVLAELPATPGLSPPGPAPYQQNVRQDTPREVRRAPDPDRPYFVGPRPYVRIAENQMGPLFSGHNHDPGITECPNGDLLAIWYTTVTERGREVAMAASRLRWGSQEWEPASPFYDAPDRNDHAPAIWYDGKQTLFHFHGQAAAATWGPLSIVMRTSTDNGVTWSRARFLTEGHHKRRQVAESVFRTKEGYLVLPADATPGGNGGTAIHISRDGGKTWEDPGGTIAGIHAGVSQLKDGRLIAFGRGDAVEGKMPMSLSTDMGKSWTYHASPFPPVSGGQRVALERLREGTLLLITFTGARNGGAPMPLTDASGRQRPVRGMFAALSYDEGRTWPRMRLITDDGPDRTVRGADRDSFTLGKSNSEPGGYLSVCQARNGLIHLVSSRNHYTFNLKWLETPPPAL